MTLNKIYNGDVLETMKEIPNNFINCIITSPPYWQLRDYGWTGQWGLEKTFNEYIDNLVNFMSECKRVLTEDGTIFVNLGDTYGGSNGNGYKQSVAKDNGAYSNSQNFSLSKLTGKNDFGLDKCLLLIPHRFAIRCIDELNLVLRNDIIWAKPNGMPESVRDRFSKKHEFIFFFAKNQKYYFDLDSVRDDHKQVSIERADRANSSNNKYWQNDNNAIIGGKNNLSKPRLKTVRKAAGTFFGTNGGGIAAHKGNSLNHLKGKNPGDVSDFWSISTKSSKEKHYAAYNSELIDKPIVAGCPVGGIVLDPFAGTGTTLTRALQLGRQVIGIEGKKDYCLIAQENLDLILNQEKIFA